MDDNQQPTTELKHEASETAGMDADAADAPVAIDPETQPSQGTRFVVAHQFFFCDELLVLPILEGLLTISYRWRCRRRPERRGFGQSYRCAQITSSPR